MRDVVEIAFLLQSWRTVLAVDLKLQRNSTNQNHCRRTQPVAGEVEPPDSTVYNRDPPMLKSTYSASPHTPVLVRRFRFYRILEPRHR
jgi:hypothetical protein